jgi:hypothetical protein
MSVQQPTESMRTTVQLTFSLEIASMQFTPSLELSGVQLKPTSPIVSVRVARSQDPAMPTDLEITFEVTKVEIFNGSIGTIRLVPSGQQRPAILDSPTVSISGLELVSSEDSAPVQLRASHQEQASVHLTAEFRIAAIEFTSLFEISTIVLNSTSNRVTMQLPGSGRTPIESAPVFQIEQVQLGPGNELGMIRVVPGMHQA